MDIELFLVGSDEDEAMSNEPFISLKDASNYAAQCEHDFVNIYKVSAFIDFTDIEEVT